MNKAHKVMIGITGIFFLIGIAYVGFYRNGSSSLTNKKSSQTKNIEDKSNIQNDITNIRITAVGDILIHESQLKAQLNKTTKQYDFTNNFKYVKQHISNADLAIANLETSLSKGEKGYSGYPVFVSPSSIVDALQDTGFDLLTTANNHIYDGGAKGFFTTQQILKEKNIDYIGIRNSDDEESFIIRDIKGIKVGISNYTYENSTTANSKSINSVKVDKKVENLIDTFNYKNIKSNLVSMKERVENMRSKGAEIIIFYVHWGEEYERKPNKSQKELAQGLADLGVDIVFASHPHVLQPIEYVKSKVEDKETLIVYSLGNFISNQRYEILKQRYSEDGLIVNVDIEKDEKNNKISIKDVSYISTWVNRYENNNNFVYEIVPVDEGLKDKQAYNLITEEMVWRAENSGKNTMAIIEESSGRVVSTFNLDSNINANNKK